MPNLSLQLAQLISEVYASSSNTGSAATSVAKSTQPKTRVKKAANLGSATAATTHAVTHALSAAKIGANEIGLAIKQGQKFDVPWATTGSPVRPVAPVEFIEAIDCTILQLENALPAELGEKLSLLPRATGRCSVGPIAIR